MTPLNVHIMSLIVAFSDHMLRFRCRGSCTENWGFHICLKRAEKHLYSTHRMMPLSVLLLLLAVCMLRWVSDCFNPDALWHSEVVFSLFVSVVCLNLLLFTLLFLYSLFLTFRKKEVNFLNTPKCACPIGGSSCLYTHSAFIKNQAQAIKPVNDASSIAIRKLFYRNFKLSRPTARIKKHV